MYCMGCGPVVVWYGQKIIKSHFFLKKKYLIVLWACGRVVWSKYERPSTFPFKTQIVLCCGLVAVWDDPNMRDLQFFLLRLGECCAAGLWLRGMVQQ
jgi:hypothetical protein